MPFPPIAIVGQGCVLPGALSPAELWELVRDGRSVLSRVPEGLWRLAPQADREKLSREIATDVGGYVRGFDRRFDPHGFQVPAASLAGLDAVFLWPLHAGRQALASAGLDATRPHPRGVVVMGNLGYPTAGLIDLALEVWSGGPDAVDPRNRFMSGLPAHLVAQALGFGAGALAVDAACASSLYAIKLACDRLHDGTADLALAGGVNHADDLFLHAGFAALRALSPTGQSRPFHRHADGLVPAQGAALVVLKRLEDAERAGDRVLGVIRGIGLTNDGRGRGLLVPGEEGQVQALTAAYAMSGVDPRDVSLVECHATGTPVGDGTEIRSMRGIFHGVTDLPLGSLKSNMGHLVTASGAAALLKVLAAMEAGVRPPSIHADTLLEGLESGPLRVVREAEPWIARGPRLAAISNFGFGGNNAHLVLEQWHSRARAAAPVPAAAPVEVAVIARAVLAGAAADLDALFTDGPGEAGIGPRAHAVPDFDLELAGLKFPPADLREALPQQLLLLRAATTLSDTIAKLPRDRTGLCVGMQTDAGIARFAIRWVHPAPPPPPAPPAPAAPLSRGQLNVAAVVGCMPNILANRLSHQFDLRGPCFTVSAEEVSGTRAVEVAVRALSAGELDAALVAAVELACEEVQEAAADRLLPEVRRTSGDAAVVLVLKRLADAQRDGDPVIAVITPPARAPGLSLAVGGEDAGLTPRFGHAHAAAGLLHVAAAVEACARRALITPRGPMPWLPSAGGRRVRVDVEALGGQSTVTWLRAENGSARAIGAHPDDPRGTGGSRAGEPHPVFLGTPPGIALYAAEDVDGLVRALRRGEPVAGGRAAGESSSGAAGAFRVALMADRAPDLDALAARAAGLLGTQRVLAPGMLEEGIHFGAGPLSGELAFVFTGPAGAYTEMGRDLALAFPELVDRLAARMRTLREAAGWVFDAAPGYQAEPVDKLWGASFLAQLHAEFTRWLLDLKPTASIGYCSGETNALFAMGAWNDLDDFRRAIDESEFYGRRLSGELEAVRRAWKLDPDAPVDWAIWRIRAPLADVRAACAEESRAHVTIVNTASDVVIGGDPAACGRVTARFGPRASRVPGYDFVMHCPEARVDAGPWRELHHRPTAPVPGVRFYTHATCDSYAATADAAADALTGQAMDTVNFPALIERAWSDGVRVFVEHGPHGGCTKWIDDALGSREHLALALDRFGRSSLAQATEGAARLAAAGVPVNLDRLASRLAGRGFDAPGPAHGAKPSHRLHVVSHHDAPRLSREVKPARVAPPAAVPGDGRDPVGPRFDRAALERHAAGALSDAFGERFRDLDEHPRRVRLPEPPLLLLDRVLGISGEAASMGRGTVWSETDVPDHAWYLHAGRMPTGLLIESGQAERLLVSWLGADFHHRGDRGYRLLGFQLKSHGPLPQPGDTVRQEVHVDGHARQGEVSLVFFHTDFSIAGDLRLSLRNGQAGFFTDAELTASAGVLWNPATALPAAGARVDPPTVTRVPTALSPAALAQLAEGNLAEAFGAGFERAAGQRRTPTIPAGRLRLVDAVTHLDPAGGPWGRGYLRATRALTPEDWFFSSHFRDDPYMPGTLLLEGGVQAMELYLAALGHTLECDGWRFELLPGMSFDVKCRGQATPASREASYEVFVDELHGAPFPTLIADVLGSIDGRKAFHVRRLGLRLVPA